MLCMKMYVHAVAVSALTKSVVFAGNITANTVAVGAGAVYAVVAYVVNVCCCCRSWC